MRYSALLWWIRSNCIGPYLLIETWWILKLCIGPQSPWGHYGGSSTWSSFQFRYGTRTGQCSTHIANAML